MGSSFTLSAAVAALSFSLAANAVPYQMTNNWQGGNFFDAFDFITSPDVSGGWVTYVDEPTAQSRNMMTPGLGAPTYIGVDHSSDYDPAGNDQNRRAATRLQSKTLFNKGLFIIDVVHMPGGICGVWPAFWMVGPNWPHNGEWDIVEGVNVNTRNQMTAHTDAGCSTNGAGAVGSVVDGNCNDNSAYNGCGTLAQNTASFGAPFNANGGGVWATEWTDTHISTWFFARDAIPSNIANPDPSTWGPPGAILSNSDGCNIDQFYSGGMNIILNTDFCGGWVAGDWGNSGCQAATQTADCPTYVAQNPGAFTNAYWSVNYLRYFNVAPGYHADVVKDDPSVVSRIQNHAVLSMLQNVTGVFGPSYKGGPE